VAASKTADSKNRKLITFELEGMQNSGCRHARQSCILYSLLIPNPLPSSSGMRYTWSMTLGIVAAIVFLLNLPFGYWRSRVRKFSAQWMLAIHLPVPLVIACRVFSGLGWQLISFPVMIGAFFGGQFLGGWISRNQSVL
jgi:hypothetical protein